jgi:hypothetical protein
MGHVTLVGDATDAADAVDGLLARARRTRDSLVFE